MEHKEVKRIPGYHPVTIRLIAGLETGKCGDELTDEKLTEIAGMPCAVGENGYGYLLSATRYLEKEGVVWSRVKGEHKITCLNSEQKIVHTHESIKRIRRMAKRGATVISGVEPDSLPQDKRVHAMALGAQLGAIALLSKRDATKKLIGSGSAVPQIGDAMKLFDK